MKQILLQMQKKVAIATFFVFKDRVQNSLCSLEYRTLASSLL